MTKSPMKNDIRFAFFGTSHIARYVLEELEYAKLIPTLVVTPEAKPQGRGKVLHDCAVAAWAKERGVALAHDWEHFRSSAQSEAWDVAVIVDYGKILPQEILAIPKHGFLNVHPSLLPRLRGSSPMRSAILKDDRETGVTIILVDEKMDHGPIIAQKKAQLSSWPLRNAELERILMKEGGKLLVLILPLWVRGEIDAHPQNHDLATFCSKFTKEDGELDLSADPYHNLLKMYAFEGWPGTFALFQRTTSSGTQTIRVQIIDAHIEDNKLIIDRVKPEGKKEMSYQDFTNSGAKPLRE